MTGYITAIGEGAFSECHKLETFKATKNLTTIKARAFEGCNKLEFLDFTDSLNLELGEYVFTNCSSITKLDLPNAISSIGTGCFANCANLEKVILRNKNLNRNKDLKTKSYIFNACTQLHSAGPIDSGLDIEFA
jgi:hypothetical protein